MPNQVLSKYFQPKPRLESRVAIATLQENLSTNHEHEIEIEIETEKVKRQRLMTSEERLHNSAHLAGSESVLRASCSTHADDDYGSSGNLTPLELLFLETKRKHPNVLLLIETGYLFRMFLEDAEVVSRVLHLGVFPGHNLRTNSFPIQMLRTNIHRLVADGLKVGVMRIVETALMKVASNSEIQYQDESSITSNGLHRRELTDLYTRSTLINEDFSEPAVASPLMNSTDRQADDCNYLMCIHEIPVDTAVVRMGIFAVSPASGNMIYDSFLDGETRRELECRLSQINTVEVIVAKVGLSNGTLGLVDAISSSRRCIGGVITRVEHLSEEHFRLDRALETLNKFYSQDEPGSDELSNPIGFVMELHPLILCCLSAVLKYLRDFKLEYILKLIRFARQFTSLDTEMNVDWITVRNLQLFWSHGIGCDDKTPQNLFSIMDETMTPFGSRLMRTWISRPLRGKKDIEQRLSAVSEILHKSVLRSLLSDHLLKKQLDLERGITAIFHKKCTCLKYWRVAASFVILKKILDRYGDCIHSEIESPYIRSLFATMIKALVGIEGLLENLDIEALQKEDEHLIFVDLNQFQDASKVQSEIRQVTSKLLELVPVVNDALGIDDFQYSTYNGKEFVVLVDASAERKIPYDWITIARSKGKICCRSPQMHCFAVQLTMLQQHFRYECHLAWQQYLDKFKGYYQRLRLVVNNLAILDCLLSFAVLAENENFVRPVIVDNSRNLIQIKGGYHLMASKMQSFVGKNYIRNDTVLGEEGPICLILGGPNMGGKSCYARQVALIVLMAQIGSYVPADSATITPLDAIYVRSGVRDCIVAGLSTFYVEVSEVASILNQATSKSLIILDGFGQSTSDSDGSALAFGVFRYCLEKISCLLIAVNHFEEVTTLEQLHQKRVKTYHMSTLVSGNDGDESKEETITYLYQLEEGVSIAGHARNVAKLAGIDGSILQAAALKSDSLRRQRVTKRTLATFCELYRSTSKSSLIDLVRTLKIE